MTPARSRRPRPGTRLVLALLGTALAVGPAWGQVRFGPEAGEATVQVTSWRELPFRTVVRQQHDFSCGSAAVATLLTFHYGQPTAEVEAFRQMYALGDQAKIRQVGFSMLDMVTYLSARGLDARGYRLSFEELSAAATPAIVLIQLGGYRHFVVVKGIRGDRVLLGDPALGVRAVPRGAFLAMWNGIALLLQPPPGRAPRFNIAAEWDAPPAPLEAGARLDTASSFTRTQLPLYQITSIFVLTPRSGP